MGQEKDAKAKKSQFNRFQVNKNLLALAKPECMIMHCLPAHRGEEITADVIDGKIQLSGSKQKTDFMLKKQFCHFYLNENLPFRN